MRECYVELGGAGLRSWIWLPVLAGGGSLAVTAAALPGPAAAVAWLSACVYTLLLARTHVLRRAADSVLGLWFRDGCLHGVVDRHGRTHAPLVAVRSFVAAPLVILNLGTAERRFNVVVVPAVLGSADRHLLRFACARARRQAA